MYCSGRGTTPPVTANRQHITQNKIWSPGSVEIRRTTHVFMLYPNWVFLFSATLYSFSSGFAALCCILKDIFSGQRRCFFTTKGHCYFNNQFFPMCPNTLSQHCHYHKWSSISGPVYRQCMLKDFMVLTTKNTKISLPTHLSFTVCSICYSNVSAHCLKNDCWTNDYGVAHLLWVTVPAQWLSSNTLGSQH